MIMLFFQYTIHTSLIHNEIDWAADLPIIGVYYTFNIIQVALSVGASVCVLRFHFRGHKPNRLPYLVKKFLFMKDSNINSKVFKSNTPSTSSLNELEDNYIKFQKFKPTEIDLFLAESVLSLR